MTALDEAKKLTRAQVEALGLIAERPRYTTTSTCHGYVSGACAAALKRRGYARYQRLTSDAVSGEWLVAITDRGRAVIAAWVARG
jgi:hypothetical protein